MHTPGPLHYRSFSLKSAIGALLVLLQGSSLFAATYYIAPTGSDTNAGTLAAPFQSITQAQTAASAGDVVYLRGGTYSTFSIASSDVTYNYVHAIAKSGISYLAYTGETPIFDFTSVSAASKRVCAFLVTGSNNTFQGFQVTGIQVASQDQAECFRINSGDGNKFSRLQIHDCPAIGIYIQKTASNTLVENCDAYNLVGVVGISAGNIDGFGCHSSGAGNTFRGCRAWNVSDDGYDCINAAGAVTFDHCWSYKNGSNGGNGNGFKVGGWGGQLQTLIPNPVPVHTVTFCLSAKNSAHGFYANHQCGQAANWTNNTAYSNGNPDFNMLERTSPVYTDATGQTNANDIPGTREVMHNNLAYLGTITSNLNETGAIVSNNSWTKAVTVNAADFVSVTDTQMTNARLSDGSLPTITFMHLVSGSDCVGLGCF